VIVDHLTGWPGGGFVGVDIFFVISGFLITGLLLRERQTTGRISFTGFYKRRIRRIIPAIILVTVVTVLASFYLLNAGRGRQTLVDGVWSLFFSANWRFAVSGTDYFQAGGPRSPFEHFWSLGVEEQFYLVWPWIMVAIFALVNRRVDYASRVAHRLVGVVMALIVLVSFVYASFLTSNPTWAYFSTFARVWELGVGALLAVMAATLASIPAAWRPALAWLGLAGIFTSFFVIDENTQLLGTWGTIPVLSAALVIAAGTGAQPRYLLPLTHPVSVWVGELSYSLYLWHFPVIILMASVLPKPSVLYYVSSSLLILGLSVAAFYGLEDPVRKSAWLTGLPAEEKRRRLQPLGRAHGRRLVGAGSLALACLMFVGIVVTRQQPSSVAAEFDPQGDRGSSATEGRTKVKAERAAAVTAALSATEWPELNPGLADLGNAVASPPCALTYGSPPILEPAEIERRCVQGDAAARRTVLVLGDSLANSYLPAVLAAVEPKGWNVVSLTRSGCPAIDIELLQVGSLLPYPDCYEQQERIPEVIKKIEPDLILVTSSPRSVRDLLASKATGAEALRQWGDAAEASLNVFSKTAPVVVLQGPPRGRDLRECATRFSKPADCVSTPTSNYFSFGKTEKKAVKALDDRDVKYVKTQRWFCSADVRCPSYVGTTPTFADGGHLTVDAARSLSPLVREALDEYMDD
jgi:peptidoglycan/LPS O-acetylase OafA/YrhL